MDLRRFVLEDVEPVVEFAVDGMQPHLSPHLLLDRDKVRAMVRHFVFNRSDWHLAAFEQGRPVAVVAALVAPMMFFERHEAHVVMCRSVRPGAGVRLIGELMAWAKGDPRIRQVTFVQEPDADPRQMTMLRRRFGFQRSQQVGLWAKE